MPSIWVEFEHHNLLNRLGFTYSARLTHEWVLQVRVILQEHGVVCICRTGQDSRQLLLEHDILFSNRVSLPLFCSVSVLGTNVQNDLLQGLIALETSYLEPKWSLFFH